MSENFGKLAEALAKAQGEMRPAVLDKVNPHFKSKYASLTSVWESCRGPLAKHGLSVVQTYGREENGGQWVLLTRLIHASGESIIGSFPIISQGSKVQEFCAAASYARRYGLSSIVGIVCDEDDDGNAAANSERKPNPPPPRPETPKVAGETDLKELRDAVNKSGIPVDEIKKMIRTGYGVEDSRHLTPAQVKEFTRHISSIVKNKTDFADADKMPFER